MAILLQALYHALPMNYVTVAKLQSKLDGEVGQVTVRKLIDKMTQDGFVEAKSNRRLGMQCEVFCGGYIICILHFGFFFSSGKRVIHSDLTERKLDEVKKALQKDHMVISLTRWCSMFLIVVTSIIDPLIAVYFQDMDIHESGNN